MEPSSDHDAEEWLRQRQADVKSALQSTEVTSSSMGHVQLASDPDLSPRQKDNGSQHNIDMADNHTRHSVESPPCNGNGHAIHQSQHKGRKVEGRKQSNKCAEVSAMHSGCCLQA